MFTALIAVVLAADPGSRTCPCPLIQPPARLATVTAAAADLVVPVGGKADTSETTHKQLIRMIKTSVAPDSWAERGGRGSIEYYPLTMSLVVNQTPEIQEQVAGFLAKLRKEQDVSVCVELRLVTVSAEHFAKLGISEPQSGTAPAVALLDDAQLQVLLKSAQEDPDAVVTVAPRMTCFNGQKATIEVGDKQTFITGVEVAAVGDARNGFKPKTTTVTAGFQAYVQPAVAADRKSVTLGLGVQVTRAHAAKAPSHTVVSAAAPEAAGDKAVVFTQHVAQPRFSTFKGEATLKVPDGKTALLSGWTHLREESNETAPPQLGKLPYLNQLFRNVPTTRNKDHLLVLVTPKIIVSEEAEEVKTASPCAAQADRVGSTMVSSNTRSFSLAYEVANVGSSKVAGVEVHFTRDGKSWERYPDEVQPLGSVPVTVAKDGRYGFTLVARSKAGLARPAPQAGDEPQLWVEVDTTQPEAVLYEPRFDKASPGSLSLTWTASDHKLADNPVSLEWAADKAGPWTFIGDARLANTGRFLWQVPEQLPAKVYLRLTVRDEAGNVAVAETPQPVVTDVKVPEVRDVRLKGRK